MLEDPFAGFLFVHSLISRDQHQLSLSIPDQSNHHVICVYPPATAESYYWKSVQLDKKGDLLVLNTTNNEMFFSRFSILLERKGKVLVETDNMENLQRQVGKKYNVLYSSQSLLFFSN